MAHAAFDALNKQRREILNTLNECGAEIPAPGMSDFWARKLTEVDRKILTCCPSCGGARSRQEGARDHQCRDCTARDEYAATGP